MLANLVRIALLSNMSVSVLFTGLLCAWVVQSQTETVYLTQLQTIYTACECPLAIPAGLPPALSLSTESIGTLSTPAVVSVLGGTTSENIVPAVATSTLTATFPSFSALSTEIIGASSTPSLLSTATIASVVSLSNGLGPLLSPGTTTTSTSGSVPTLSALSDASSSDIHVIENTIAPTAASSDLTTSGIPQSLSVNLSLVIPNSALESSAALISFGSSSPAVYSTILPPGESMGTSSVGLTTYSTIALNSVSLTGVTLLAPRSPTSCFTLPTPAASMDMIAVAVVPLDDYELSNPMIFSFGDNGTIPQYVSALASGNPYILNLSPDNPVSGQLGLHIPGDEALVFDGSGMHLYTGNCTSLTQVLIDDFYSQLGSMAGVPSRRATAVQFGRRQSLTSSAFTVEVAVDSFLNTASFSPNLTFGDSQCTLQLNTPSSTTNNITWSCMYPPPMGGVASCSSSLSTWLNVMTAPSTSPANTTEVLATLSPFLALAGNSILDLFPGSDPALGMGFTFMRQVETAAKEAMGDVGSSACEVLHAFDSDDLVLADSGPLGTQTLGSYMTAPPPSLGVNLAASATASITGIPRRKANPTDNFLKQIATDFKSIFGAFTHWLHGLPHLPHFTLGFEETGSLPPGAMLTNPVVTITGTSTSTLATPSIVHVQMPTVTVTHVLGDGWFSPSTYVIGPGTSTVPQFPALAASGSNTISPSTRPTWISLEEYMDFASSSSPTYASSHIVDSVVAQLAAMDLPDAGVQTGHRWDLPNPQSSDIGTTTTGDSLGYDGHIVVVTTTVYLSDVNFHA